MLSAPLLRVGDWMVSQESSYHPLPERCDILSIYLQERSAGGFLQFEVVYFAMPYGQPSALI